MSDENLNELIEILADNAKPLAERKKALLVLQVASLQGPRFSPYQTDFMAALRAASEATEFDLRVRVLEILCLDKDRTTQKRLIEGLDDPAREQVPPEKALQFLSFDVHAGVFPIARRVAGDPPNDLAQHEALRILAGDPESVGLFASTFEDSAEDLVARRLSLVGLKSLDPERFIQSAKKVAADGGSDEDVRTMALLGLVQSSTDPEDVELLDLAEALLEDEASSPSMQRSARALAARTRRPVEDAEDNASDGDAVSE